MAASALIRVMEESTAAAEIHQRVDALGLLIEFSIAAINAGVNPEFVVTPSKDTTLLEKKNDFSPWIISTDAVITPLIFIYLERVDQEGGTVGVHLLHYGHASLEDGPTVSRYSTPRVFERRIDSAQEVELVPHSSTNFTTVALAELVVFTESVRIAVSISI